MPVVLIQQSAGRSIEQRRKLIAGVTKAFEEAYGLSADAITVFFQDFDDGSWGKEGLLHADRKLSANTAKSSNSTARLK
jgi:4-oxalocrotonate tautomerase